MSSITTLRVNYRAASVRWEWCSGQTMGGCGAEFPSASPVAPAQPPNDSCICLITLIRINPG